MKFAYLRLTKFKFFVWSDRSIFYLLQRHLNDEKFDYFTDKTLRIFPRGRNGPSIKFLREGPEMRKEPYQKIIIFDYDNIVNRLGSDPPAKYYILYIIDKNSFLKSKKESVLENFVMLEKADNPSPHADALSYYFRKGELAKGLHLEACYYAANNFDLATNFNSAIERLRDMAYRPFILSASPEDLVQKSRRRLGIAAENIKATPFHFDSRGIFERMELNMGESRATKRDEIMKQSVSTKYGLEIMVDDNQKTGSRIAKSGWKHIYFWAGEAEPTVENISIKAPELRENPEKIVIFLKRLERAIAVPVVIPNEERYMGIVKTVNNAVAHYKLAMRLSGSGHHTEKRAATSFIRKYNREVSGMYPANKTELLENLKEIDLEKNTWKSKRLLNDFMRKFIDSSLEARMPENLAAVA